MNRLAVAVGCVAIAAASFAIGRTTAPTVAPRIVKRSGTTVRAAADQRAAPSDDALEECQTRLALAQGVLEALEHEKVGDPVPFPDDLPEQYRPAGFEDAVNHALEACASTGLERGHVDCTEFPCMVFFRQQRGSYNHAMEALHECDAWKEQFGLSRSAGNDLFMTDDGIAEYSYTSPTPSGFAYYDENLGKRFGLRASEGKAQLMADAGGRELTELEQVDQTIEFLRDVGADDVLPELEAQRERLLEKEQAASGKR